ncbi:hypothetical protein [Hymenobacter nivis]|uniref:Uncharacterized protein n=1 Tax=Hymenobacter nivis TaxID=1850093 RepID=A0A2Z3GRS0_9BACT|nr:hypothetical protein [Hymenobacter nivis]AWM31350.1 hypothetical protein DDQ68_00245 [Hymenobacter nivis]
MKKRPAGSEREDSQANRAKIRKALLAFIKKYTRVPTVQELAAATGFSDKTIKQHRRRIQLGDGLPNDYQQLTPDVLLALHARAVGYSHPAKKIFNDKLAGIVKADYTEHYPPDAAAAKLWVQLIEGFSEKKETKHSGEVGLALTFNYVAPAAPDTLAADAGH